ncbi:MAG: lipid-binding SYLF domain-containing protein [Acidobacteriota bacterium]
MLSVLVSVGVRADADRLNDATAVLKEMAGTFDSDIPKDLFTKAECVVIIPGMKKGAMGFGGQYGRGYMICRTKGGWSAPSGMRIEGGSVGFQIGGSSTDVILLVMSGRGVDKLLDSKFTVGADAAVAAGPLGRAASAQTDVTMHAEMLAWSRSRGVFAGVSLQGSTLRTDGDENKELYGKDIAAKDIVRGNMKAPAAAKELMAALAKY